MPSIIIDLRISPKDLLGYYQGVAKNIIAPSLAGQRVQLPIASLRSFVTSHGIQGRFEILYSENGKLLNISQIS